MSRKYTLRKRRGGGWYVIRRHDGVRVYRTNRLISALRLIRNNY